MAATANIVINGSCSNLPGVGQQTIGPATITTAAAVGEQLAVTLASGANTVTVPTGTTIMYIVGPNKANPIPNPGYAGTLAVKGVTGDTGIPFSAAGFYVATWDATGGVNVAPANIVITTSTTGATVEITFW